jgi:hypothetical protein
MASIIKLCLRTRLNRLLLVPPPAADNLRQIKDTPQERQ